jgi:hypothetical protein
MQNKGWKKRFGNSAGGSSATGDGVMSGPMGNGKRPSLATPRSTTNWHEQFSNALEGTRKYAIRW